MTRILTALLAVFSFASCMSVQKATDYLKEKGQLANVCADNFPPIRKVDTIEREVSADSNLLKKVAEQRDSLAGALAILKQQPKELDSAACVAMRASYERFLTQSLRKVDSLERRLKTACKEREVRIKEIDTIHAAQQRSRGDSLFYLLQKERADKVKVQAEKEQLQAKVKGQRRTIWTLGGVMALLLLVAGIGIGWSIRRKKRQSILSQ